METKFYTRWHGLIGTYMMGECPKHHKRISTDEKHYKQWADTFSFCEKCQSGISDEDFQEQQEEITKLKKERRQVWGQLAKNERKLNELER